MHVKKSGKLIVRLAGGLGNQMFCYAAARRLAKVNDAELVIDDEGGFIYDTTYNRTFMLDLFNISGRLATSREKLRPFDRGRRKLLRARSKNKNFSDRPLIFQELRDFDLRLLDLKFAGTRYFEGVWASAGYFEDIATIIREDLGLKKRPQDAENRTCADLISSSNSVALFVRWFDDPTIKDGQNTPPDYYQRAIELIESRLDKPHYFIFSDQPEAVRTHLSLPDQRHRIINHNDTENMAYADLWLGSLCRHFIIANSTFGWWSAWLGADPAKIVIAPSTKTVTAPNWTIEGFVPEKWLRM
jgi:Glycosyl transferase family 11